MIVGHHGAELPLVLTTLVGAGAPVLVLVRARLDALRRWTRRR